MSERDVGIVGKRIATAALIAAIGVAIGAAFGGAALLLKLFIS